MFRIGDLVVYGKMGVCTITAISSMSFGGDDEADYYVLCPKSDRSSCVYVPCNNAQLLARMRPLLTKEEIDRLLRDAHDEQIEWIDDKNERTVQFRDIVTQGDRGRLICLVRCLLDEQKARATDGKKLSSADEAVLKECVRLVEEEFSCALDISPQDVGAYIREALEAAR